MVRIYQAMGSRADEVVRNALAGGQVAITGAAAADVANNYGGFNTSAVAGSRAVLTWRATNSGISPVIVGVGEVAAVTDVGAETDARHLVVEGIASNSCAIGVCNGAGALTVGTANVMVLGQARNDFKTT